MALKGPGDRSSPGPQRTSSSTSALTCLQMYPTVGMIPKVRSHRYDQRWMVMTSEQTERACQIWRTLPPTEADATPDDWRVSFETLAREHWRPAPDVVTSDVDAGGVPALWVRTPDGPE